MKKFISLFLLSLLLCGVWGDMSPAQDTGSTDSMVEQAMALWGQERFKEAMTLFQKVAEQGHTGAQLVLGNIYLFGDERFVAKDEKKAVQWLSKAAEQGNQEAKELLGGFYYEQGRYKEALPLLQEAAEQGSGEAQHNLALMYFQGNGVAQNEQTAMQLLNNAAEQGYARSQFYLGMLLGAEGNEQLAIKWLRKAALQGNVMAQEALKSLGQKK